MEQIQSVVQKFTKSIDDCEFTFRGKIHQSVYIREEIAEVLKELSKDDRNKGNNDHIIEEEIDLITTLFVDLRRRGVSFEKIFNGSIIKTKRAMGRFYASGEL